jgi:hypothetical protein
MKQIGFYCKTYCPLNMFQGTIMPIIRSSRVIQMVLACGTWRFGLVYPQPGHINLQLHTRPTNGKQKRHVPQEATICITL